MNVFISDEDYERATKNGINKDNLNNRVRYSEWDVERAVTEPVKSRPKKSRHGEWLQIARDNGIYNQLFQSRVNLGWTSEQAALMPIGKRGVKVV